MFRRITFEILAFVRCQGRLCPLSINIKKSKMVKKIQNILNIMMDLRVF